MPDNNSIGASTNSNLRFIEFPLLSLASQSVPTPQQMEAGAKASPSYDLRHTGARAAGLQMLNGYPTPSEPRRVSYVLRPNAPVADDGFAVEQARSGSGQEDLAARGLVQRHRRRAAPCHPLGA
jgi:hypothetical protein